MKTHIGRLLDKLGARDRAQLVIAATRPDSSSLGRRPITEAVRCRATAPRVLHLTQREDLTSTVGDRMSGRRWKVGELADATGLTVRAMHHFDDIGLVKPAERSASGHRLYTSDDVRRLYQVLALRDLGMPLSEIAGSLDTPEGDLGRAVRRQLDQVDRLLAAQQRLRPRLAAVLQAMEQAGQPAIDQLVETMEAMMQAKYFTPDQLTRLKQRHDGRGRGLLAEWMERGAALDAEIREQVSRGTDPADPAAQELARRWIELMDDMLGGDRFLRASMYRKIDEQGPETATRGVLSTPAWDFLKRAFVVGFGDQWRRDGGRSLR